MAEPVAHTAHQHRYVGALPTAISVKLIEDDEIQPLGITDDGAIELVLARHQELEHHKVGQQNVGLALSDALPFLLAFLPGVTRKARPQPLRQLGLIKELLELLHLAVSQCIHRIDDDGASARRFSSRARAYYRV